MGKNVILNPHYKDMGNLYGSEYWTYLLPKAGRPRARASDRRGAIADGDRGGAAGSALLANGLPGDIAGADCRDSRARTGARRRSRRPGAPGSKPSAPRAPLTRRRKPLAAYREEELKRVRRNFYGLRSELTTSARYNFIRKIPKSRTPLTPPCIGSSGRRMADAASKG